MKRLIQSFACFGLIAGCLPQSTLGQTQDNDLVTKYDHGPVTERLDQVINALAKLSDALAKLEIANSESAKEDVFKTTSKHMSNLNTSIEVLANQLKSQSKTQRQKAQTANKMSKLLEKLVTLQENAADRSEQPVPEVKWEYKSIFGDSRVALEEEMNQFGQDGWVFFNITTFGRGSAAFARRPVR